MSSKYILTAADAEVDSVFEPKMRFHSRVLIDGVHAQLIWVKYEPGGDYPMHSHPHEQISVMLQGRMRLTVGEEVKEIGPGDMWYAPANVPHGGEILGEDPVVFVDIYAPRSASVIEYLDRLRPMSAD